MNPESSIQRQRGRDHQLARRACERRVLPKTCEGGLFTDSMLDFCTTLAILSFDPSGLMARARQRIARAPAPGIKNKHFCPCFPHASTDPCESAFWSAGIVPQNGSSSRALPSSTLFAVWCASFPDLLHAASNRAAFIYGGRHG